MKIRSSLLLLLAGSLLPLLGGCSSSAKKPSAPAAPAKSADPKSGGKSVAGQDDLDEYGTSVTVADPLEPLNRATFWINDGIYTIALRPISKGYDRLVPKVIRTGIYNAYENVKFPVRLVNHLLQGNFPRAGQETGKFLVNSTAGIGGLGRPSDHIPALADVPSADTGQTFAKWGIGNGPYLVLPLLGPSTLRDTVGLAGDYALNPITWVCFVYGDYDWIIAIPAGNTMRAMPGQIALYDTITKDSLDRYLAARSAYIQNRAEAAQR
ncbi:MAG TPA: VacJ family lipoprotein [Chthoniobacterales bacterium]|jgi:phospholipid-binding lipoprotein MlaA